MLTMDPISSFVVNYLVGVTAELIMPLMLVTFLGGVMSRLLIYYYARAEHRFTQEFEKRTKKRIDEMATGQVSREASFTRLTKELLEQTYHECFELRNRYKRRNFDHITSVTDRLFLIQEGVSRSMEDTIKQARYVRRDSGSAPTSTGRWIEFTKTVFDGNPFFNRLMGVFPIGLVNELVNILPGLFIIGGIFGTFLGISKGLPELGHMDLGQIEETKKVMDAFLVSISVAMIKSVVGIALSVMMSLINTLLSPDALYYGLVNRFASSLEQIWHETTTNEIDRVETAPEQAVGESTQVIDQNRAA